ncbi:MAG TPA: hypothetical protein VF329_04205 [Gammaproteobacteria bacterium]
MSSGEKVDPTNTYVLEETAVTKAMTIEELAKLATTAPDGGLRHENGAPKPFEGE